VSLRTRTIAMSLGLGGLTIVCSSHQHTTSVGAALIVGFLSLSMANAEGMSDSTSLSYWAADIFASAVRDDTAASGETEWSDVSALGYARSGRSGAPGVRWLTQPMPAVDGINAKIAGFGGGANHTDGFYGTTGSLAFPIAQQWGAQIDGGVGGLDGSGWSRGAGHLFWRDPSIGLVGAYGSYFHWNGTGALSIPRIGINVSRFAAEGEYYWSRWTVRGVAGYETVHLNVPNVAGLSGLFSVPNRFFDWVSASYYVTDDFKLSIGHLYTFGRNGLTLGSEHGFALGGGRMASLFAGALFAEGGNNAVLGGVRFYLGQRDKTLIDRHRQDDPEEDLWGNGGAGGAGGAGSAGGAGAAALCDFHHPC
jgi:hypothetical protein